MCSTTMTVAMVVMMTVTMSAITAVLAPVLEQERVGVVLISACVVVSACVVCFISVGGDDVVVPA